MQYLPLGRTGLERTSHVGANSARSPGAGGDAELDEPPRPFVEWSGLVAASTELVEGGAHGRKAIPELDIDVGEVFVCYLTP